MLSKTNKLIAAALIISVLLHAALFVFDSAENAHGDPQFADVTIAVNLQASTKPVEHAKTKKAQSKESSLEKVIATENLSSRIKSSAPNTSTSSPLNPVLPVDEVALAEKEEVQTETVDVSEQLREVAQLDQPEEKRLNGEERRLLLNLLYSEINAHKKYPYIAIRQRREGRVSVNFILHPDGHISDVEIQKSSDHTVLDRAATRAVEQVQPLQLAATYLQQTELFNVDIEFRLN